MHGLFLLRVFRKGQFNLNLQIKFMAYSIQSTKFEISIFAQINIPEKLWDDTIKVYICRTFNSGSIPLIFLYLQKSQKLWHAFKASRQQSAWG